MSSVYETKMPAYLAMSKGDLIAEIVSNGEAVTEHLENHEEPEPDDAAEALMLAISGESTSDMPPSIKTSSEIVRIANNVLKERFGITIMFHYGDREDF